MGKGKGFFSFFLDLFEQDVKKVTLIIPALNEEKTIDRVIKRAQLVKEISEIIVIDDGSRDKTAAVAKKEGVIVIRHHENLGKGEAIKTGIYHANGEILLFLDADLENITPEKIRALILPILRNKADFTKATFTRARGRVTEFAIKPMMRILYPETSFKQPISGQFAARKKFMRNITIEPKWGIDISILLDAIKHGQRVVEVNLGELIHKKRADSEVAETSRQVMETILKKSGFICSKHKLIIFSDNVLFSNYKPKKNMLLVLNKLKAKKHILVLLTSKKISHEYQHFFDLIKSVNAKEDSENILAIAKMICRKYLVTLGESAVVANTNNFWLLSQNCSISFCFESSKSNLKKSSTNIIQTLSDIILFWNNN